MDKKIEELEQIYNKKKNKNRLLLLINKYYLAFLNTEKQEYLKRAYFKTQEYLEINKTDLDIIMVICFFCFELKNIKEAEKFLNIINKYKRNLKLNNLVKYCFYIYLLAMEKFIKNYSISKYIKILEYYENQNNTEINLLIINLKLKNNTLDRNIISNFNKKDRNNFYINLTLYKIFEKSSKFLNFDRKIFNSYIKWGYRNCLNLEKSLAQYYLQLDFNTEDEIYNQKFYLKYKYDFILERITEEYINKNSISEIAFFFYKEAINRQLNLEGLIFNYIKGCYKFKIEDIGLYPMKKFLENKEIDFEIIAFVYHIILTNKKYSELLNKYHSLIIKYALYFLEKKFVGRYYYSIYKYLLDNLANDEKLENKILNILYPIYYEYEITTLNENAKWILIKDEELRTIREYEIINKKAYIQAISNNFSYYLLEESKKEIISSEIFIEKSIEENSTKIALKFYSKNLINKFSLINLGKYFLSLEKPDNKIKNILLKILEIEDLARPFKNKIIHLIASTYFYEKDYENATLYFKKIPENEINDRYIDNILMSYIYSLENEKAIEIITRKSHIISDDILYIALRSISEDEKNDRLIAPFIYEILMKGKIDNLFIEILIKNYKGGLLEWLELRQCLEEKGIIKKSIDEHILKETIYTHNLNAESEKIFAKLFNFDIENIILEDFLNYCIYESIFNNYVFLNETLQIMEHIFMEYEYEELGYGLAHIYLNQKFDLNEKEHIFDKVIFNMEKNKINFKIFEENKDKFEKYPYIFKSTPFIYTDLPEKNIYIFYKEINEDSFKSLKMQYFKFGMYICVLPIFFGEEIEYYFAEGTKKENILTKKESIINNYNKIFDFEDEYFKINNIIISLYEGKFQNIENLMEKFILKKQNLKGKIL